MTLGVPHRIKQRESERENAMGWRKGTHIHPQREREREKLPKYTRWGVTHELM